jgi:hypothetical protein
MTKLRLIAGVSFIVFASLLCTANQGVGWGFWAHKQIHRRAVQAMPEPVAAFFREYATFLIEHSIDADDRRRIDPTEAEQHFIDIDRYGKYPFPELPRRFEDAVKKYTLDTVRAKGVVPWRIAAFTDSVTRAFKMKKSR